MGVPTARIAALLLTLALVLTSCQVAPSGEPDRGPPASAAVNDTGSWMLETDAPGPYWLGADWFRAKGVDPTQIAAHVQLSRGEQAVPYRVLAGPDGPGLLFYALKQPSRFASWTSYRLDVGPTAVGEQMAGAPAAPPLEGTPSPSAGTASQDSAWVESWWEEDLLYRPQITAPQPWFWAPLFSGQRITFTTMLTETLSGPITVTIRLFDPGPAASTTPGPQIWWNGQLLGSWRSDGTDTQSWPASFAGPAAAQQTLVLDLPAQSPARRLWFDAWGTTVRRRLDYAAAGLSWTAEGPRTKVNGAEGAHLLDITHPDAPLYLGSMVGDSVATQPGHVYWLGVPWQAPAPTRTRLQTSVDRGQLSTADYVIIAPEAFWPELQPLVKHRQDQGHQVVLQTPTQIYDSYGDGRPSPKAIRALVRELQPAGRLRYLLLVGDASPLPADYAGAEGERLVVTELTPTHYLHETPSDEQLVTDESGKPIVAVGRFPARTPEEVEVMVTKTLSWEKTGPESVVVVADDEADLRKLADDLASWLPSAPQRLDAAQDGARSSLLEGLRAERTWLNYVGHGSLALWGDEKLLQREDTWTKPAVVVVWACLSGYFVHPEEDSLGEVWLRSKGGAAAFIGPTGETQLHDQRPLARAFYDGVRGGQAMGDALLAAWRSDANSGQEAVRSFLLLGDPALRIIGP